jgi:hypothetical protein
MDPAIRPARMILFALVAAGLASAGVPAAASPHHSTCNLVRDVAGDVSPPVTSDLTTGPDDRDDQLDLLSADIAVDSKAVTVVLRLKALQPADPSSLAGRTYQFDFSVKEQSFFFLGSLLTGGNSFALWRTDQGVQPGDSVDRGGTAFGPATGTVDVRKREIRMTTPLSTFDSTARLTPGTALYSLAAATARSRGVSPDPPGPLYSPGDVWHRVNADTGWADKGTSYRVGQSSCLKAS